MNKSQNQILERRGKKNKQRMIGTRVGFGLSTQPRAPGRKTEERRTKKVARSPDKLVIFACARPAQRCL